MKRMIPMLLIFACMQARGQDTITNVKEIKMNFKTRSGHSINRWIKVKTMVRLDSTHYIINGQPITAVFNYPDDRSGIKLKNQ